MLCFQFKRLSVAALVVCAGAATIAGTLLMRLGDVRDDGIPPEEARYGWAGPEVASQAYEQIKSGLPKFEITGDPDDDPRKRVVLWDAAKLANSGAHLPTFTQAIVTSPIFSTMNSMVFSLVPLVPLVHQAHYAPPLFILKILNLIDALANEIQAEAALAGAIEDRWRR